MYIIYSHQVAKDFLEGKVKVEDMSVQEVKKTEPVKEEPVIQDEKSSMEFGSPGNKVVINFNGNISNINLTVTDGNNLDLTFSEKGDKRILPVSSEKTSASSKKNNDLSSKKNICTSIYFKRH